MNHRCDRLRSVLRLEDVELGLQLRDALELHVDVASRSPQVLVKRFDELSKSLVRAALACQCGLELES